MPKILLACDIDNTLLHSYKNYTDGDICVEEIDGKEQGYMSSKTYAMLQKISSDILLIPITSRSVEQYMRICWPGEMSPDYAVTTNGAILLKNGKINNKWTAISNAYISSYRQEYRRLQKLLILADGICKCRMTDDMYLFALFEDETTASRYAMEIKDITTVDVICIGKKLYLLPPGINKGTAINRIKELFHPDMTICAGDSIADLPMLQEADIAIVPNRDFARQLPFGKAVRYPEGERFSDYILEFASSLSHNN